MGKVTALLLWELLGVVERALRLPSHATEFTRLRRTTASDALGLQSGVSGRVRDVLTVLAGADGIAYVTHSLNKRRIADLSSQAPDENLYQLGVIFVRVFPNPFA
jgi:hypothetical protein